MAIYENGQVLIDRYRIERYLDAGGMQEVYVATDLTFNRQVALKVPKNESAEKRYLRSARMSAKVNHPNVARTLDYFESQDSGHLIEELIDGVDFGARLREFNRLDPHLVAHLFSNLARGVAACHHVDVFHRDLKPSNVMVSRDYAMSAVKVTDFGIAKLAEEEIVNGFRGGEESITGSRTVIGALPYMAPELISTPHEASLPGDIWAWGAMCFHALVGEPPFGVGLPAVNKIINEPAPLLSMNNGDFSNPQFKSLLDGLRGVIAPCLDKDPGNRPSADKLMHMCDVLCYSNEPRVEGRIYRISDNRNWGFILGLSGENIFVHRDSVYGGRFEIGNKVSFSYYPGVPQPRAFPALVHVS